MKHSLLTLFLCTLLFGSYTAGPAGADGWDGAWSPKAIWHDTETDRHGGIRFRVLLLNHAEDRHPVPTTYPFRSGHRFLFEMETNQSSYVYIFTYTLPGEVLQAKGYTPKRLVPASDSPGKPVDGMIPRLLFPMEAAGTETLLRTGQPNTLPHRGAYRMDHEPGVEVLLIVLSSVPQDFGTFFDPKSGLLHERDGVPDRELLARFTKLMEIWRGNTKTQLVDPLVAKGIRFDPDSSEEPAAITEGHEVDGYGVVLQESLPGVVEVRLNHLPNEPVGSEGG